MPPQPPDSQMLRDSMTREVTNDAYAVSGQIFRGQEPDVARVSNDQVDQRYHQAILQGDRPYLMAEAARDPVQFLASMQRLIEDGKAMIPPGAELDQQPKLPSDARSNVPLPKVPEQAFAQPIDPNNPTPPQALPVPMAPPTSGLVPPPAPSGPVPPPMATPAAPPLPPPIQPPY